MVNVVNLLLGFFKSIMIFDFFLKRLRFMNAAKEGVIKVPKFPRWRFNC